MATIFSSPSKYIQGRNVLFESAERIRALGNDISLLVDETLWEIVGKQFYNYLRANQLNVIRASFNGQSSEEEVERLLQDIHATTVNAIVVMGGGKIIDTGKVIANRLELPVVIVPTTASTDAPTSSLSVMYSDDGVFDRYVYFKKSPDLVLVDTEIIVNAPSFLLAAGIGDAAATWIEARAVNRSGGKNKLDGSPTLAALAIAKTCRDTIFDYAQTALIANENKVITPAFEAIVEANTLLSGIGFESGGLAAAHAIHNGFSRLKGDIQRVSHGGKVAYGVLTQLLLENSIEEFFSYLQLFQSIKLPVTLSDLYLTQDKEVLLAVGEQAIRPSDTMNGMGYMISAEDVRDALFLVDEMSKKYLSNHTD